MSLILIRTLDIFGVGASCDVLFTPSDAPYIAGSNLLLAGHRSVRLASNGTGLVTLAAGHYSVKFIGLPGDPADVTLDVPDDDAVHDLAALITGGAGIVVPPSDYLLKSRNLADIADPVAAFAAIKQAATEEVSGVVQLATDAEVASGTDNQKVVTPKTLSAVASALRGPKGDTGATGAQGIQGAQGEPGEKGEPGSDASVTHDNVISALGFTPEGALGNPDANGKVLVSTVEGVRSWAAMSGGGSGGGATLRTCENRLTADHTGWKLGDVVKQTGWGGIPTRAQIQFADSYTVREDLLADGGSGLTINTEYGTVASDFASVVGRALDPSSYDPVTFSGRAWALQLIDYFNFLIGFDTNGSPYLQIYAHQLSESGDPFLLELIDQFPGPNVWTWTDMWSMGGAIADLVANFTCTPGVASVPSGEYIIVDTDNLDNANGYAPLAVGT